MNVQTNLPIHKMNKLLNTVTFTHRRDIDGMGGAILSKLAFGTEKIFYCDYSDLAEQFFNFIKTEDITKYDKIFIIDLSIKGKDMIIADTIESSEELLKRVVFIDHHTDSLPMNKYSWAKVVIKDQRLGNRIDDILFEGELTCATTIFYEWLVENEYLEENEEVVKFTEHVRKYDTWLWVNKYHDIIPRQITDLFEFYEIDEFVERFTKKLQSNKYELDETDTTILKIMDKKIKNIVQEKVATMTEKKILGFNCGIIFSELYRNDISEYVRANCPQIDIVIIIGDSFSFRTNKQGINVADFARNFGGGGSTQTAGATISKEKREKMINLLFKLPKEKSEVTYGIEQI